MVFWKSSIEEVPPPRPIVVFYPHKPGDKVPIFFHAFGINEIMGTDYFLWIECDPLIMRWLDIQEATSYCDDK